MLSKTLLRKFIAVWVTAAILTMTSVLTAATPFIRSGGLSVTGQVTVDGQSAISGGTFFSDSTIVTAADSSATLSLGRLGRIELPANSSLTLSLTDNTLVGTLHAGQGYVTTPVGVFVNIATKDGLVSVDGTRATSFTINSENNTTVSTETGLAELRTRDGIEPISSGQNAVAGSFVLPQQFIARLTTTGNQPITVNGASAASGANLLTGAIIETPAGVGATINLGTLGELEIEPGSELTLEFDHNGNVVKVNLRRGCGRLRTNENVNGEIVTPDGKTTKSDSKRRAAVCFAIATASDGGGLGTGAWTAIILGGAGAIITAVILTRDDDEVISPSR
ncbi:MAG TPA: hypothetical protein VEW46_13495 [Pyrinomonadaceae bacterium]|nr:hypothetical protein [Pyrinomonadaceae bacterium]